MTSFEELKDNLSNLEDFSLKWRFTEPKYNQLPKNHLVQLKPLNNIGSKFLWDHIMDIGIHNEDPFDKNIFQNLDYINIADDNENEIKKWLYKRGLPFDKEVFISWQPDSAMIVPWKILIKYYNDFYYPGSDDLTIIDESLNWAVLFHHNETLYFGSNNSYKPKLENNEI